MTQMSYAEVKYRNPAISTVDEYQFLINSVFDPDLTGGGHQPMGRDQLLGNIYGKYRVHTVAVKIQFATLYDSYVPTLLYVVPCNDTTALTTSLSAAIEQPRSWHNITPFGAPTPHFQGKFNLWDIWGKTRSQYLSDDITGAAYTTSPTEVIVLKVGAMSTDATKYVVYTYSILLQMEVECFDRFTLGQS
jgi:hypothetical protein